MKLFFFDRIAFSAGSEKDSFYNRYAAPVQPVSGISVCLYVLAVFVSTCTASPCDKLLNLYHPAPPQPRYHEGYTVRWQVRRTGLCLPFASLFLYKPFKKKLCLCYMDPAGHHGLGEKKSCVAAGHMLRRKAFAFTPW